MSHELSKVESQTPARAERAEQEPVFLPNVDIRENSAEVLLVADMPGVDQSSVTVDLEGSELTIRGAFLPRTPEGYSLVHHEYRSGNYERTFTLGNEIDRQGIQAVVRHGVLHLTLPKAKAAQPRRIEVQTG